MKHARPGAVRDMRIRRAVAVTVLVAVLWFSGVAQWAATWLGIFVILGVAGIVILLPGGN